jgi:hypothetical protein
MPFAGAEVKRLAVNWQRPARRVGARRVYGARGGSGTE